MAMTSSNLRISFSPQNISNNNTSPITLKPFFKTQLSKISYRTSSTTIKHKRNPRNSRPKETRATMSIESSESETMKHLLFVEMGVGYDQHGQDVTKAAIKACKDAITSNSIPAFSIGSIPGVSKAQMKLRIKLGVPRSLQQSVDIEQVKSVFPYGKILDVEVVDGGLICSSGVHVEELGDKNDDCYVVNAAVYIGY